MYGLPMYSEVISLLSESKLEALSPAPKKTCFKQSSTKSDFPGKKKLLFDRSEKSQLPESEDTVSENL